MKTITSRSAFDVEVGTQAGVETIWQLIPASAVAFWTREIVVEAKISGPNFLFDAQMPG